MPQTMSDSPGPVWRQNADKYYSEAYENYAVTMGWKEPRLSKLRDVFRAFDVQGAAAARDLYQRVLF